jgi:hypothetical protein
MGNGVEPKRVPPSKASAQIQRPLAFAIPVEGQAFPQRVGVLEHLCEGGQPRTHDTRTPHRVRAMEGSRQVDHGVEAKGRNQRDLLPGAVQPKLQNALRSVAQHLDWRSRRPAPQQADDLAGPHAECFVAQPQAPADLGRGGEHTEKGQRPALLAPRHMHHEREHDPAQTWATHRVRMTRAGAIAGTGRACESSGPSGVPKSHR